MAELKTLRILDTAILEGRLNIAIGQAIVEARQARQVPDTLRFLRFPPTALVGRHLRITNDLGSSTSYQVAAVEPAPAERKAFRLF